MRQNIKYIIKLVNLFRLKMNLWVGQFFDLKVIVHKFWEWEHRKIWEQLGLFESFHVVGSF